MGIMAFISSVIIYPYMKIRFSNWFINSNPDPTTQIERAKQALQQGGFCGSGFSESIIKDGFMAEGHTDFILPIIVHLISSSIKSFFNSYLISSIKFSSCVFK